MFNEIILASGNIDKLKEFNHLFAAHHINVLPQSQFNVPECPEPHVTFVENALAKARHASKYSGKPTLADDSGICVDAPTAKFPKLKPLDAMRISRKQGSPTWAAMRRT